MSLWRIAWRSVTQRGLASALTVISMGLGVMMVVAVLTIHGVVTESFANNSALGYNVIVGAKGGKLQLVLNTVYYLSQPVENIPYDFYLEFLPEEQRAREFENSLRREALVAQQAALEIAQAHGAATGVEGIVLAGLLAGDTALDRVCAKALDQERDGRYSVFTDFALPLCLGDYVGKFRLVGTVPEFFEKLKDLDPVRGRKLEFAEGRPFEHFNEEHGWYEAVVGSTVAREMDYKLGDVINPAHGSPEGHSHAQGFTIVGIMKPTGAPHDRAVFVNMEGFYLMDGHAKPLETDEEAETEAEGETTTAKVTRPPSKWPEPLPLEKREVTALLVRTKHPAVTQGMVTKINEGMIGQAVLPIGEIYNLFDIIVTPIRQILLVLTTMICVVSGVSILVGIYNSMSDRRRDIAVMRALGASRFAVSFVILAESLILAVGGGLLGFVAGHTLNTLAAQAVEDRTGVRLGFFTLAPGPKLSELLQASQLAWDPQIPLELVLIPAMVLLAVVVGFLPAVVAYRTDVSRSLSA
jgi:putative ABC transport system permease protein